VPQSRTEHEFICLGKPTRLVPDSLSFFCRSVIGLFDITRITRTDRPQFFGTMSSSQAEAVKLAAPLVPFSYAQAARGVSGPTSLQSSKAPSGSITPAKEQSVLPALKSELNGARWADDVDDEIKTASHSSASTAVDAQSASSIKSPAAHAVGQVNGTASPSSVDFGGSSTSTLVRDDSPMPLSEMPESAWESKSQSTSTVKPENGRSRTSADRASSRGRKKSGRRSEKKEKTDSESALKKDTWIQPVKYVEAPAPTVNPWALRAQQAKAVPAPQPSVTSTPTSTAAEVPKPTPPSKENKTTAPIVAIPSIPAAPPQAKEQTAETQAAKQPIEEKISSSKSTQQHSKPAARNDQVIKVASPTVDQASWPTPETAKVDEHKSKPQDKNEAAASTSNPLGKKHAWEKVDFTPSVVFNTTLPGQARRGGKGGSSRGAREGTSRSSASGPSERRGDSGVGPQSSETARGSSPSRTKRASHDEYSARRQSRQESLPRDASAKLAEENKSKPAENTEQATSKPSNVFKPKTNRKEYSVVNGERRREDITTGKENDTPVTSKAASAKSTAAQQPTSVPTSARKEDVSAASSERKGSVAQEFASRNHERKSSGSFVSYSGRARPERGRGGHRGGRGNSQTFHPNAHSFVNGQASAYSVQGFNSMPKSPTSFIGQDPFFGQTPQHSGQRYNRNYQPRGTSIPTDSPYVRMPNGYPGQPLQVNTAVQNGVYPADYYLPATALPYQNDPASNLLSAVTTQMEYYFSVDNLLKDMYLRKHMDSQGFVFLTFIADFKRLKSMTHDLELIKHVCQQSPNIEHRVGSDGIDRLRVAKGWEQWVLPKADRDQTAQNDGPESLHQPPRPHPQYPDQSHLLRHSSLPTSHSAGAILGGQPFQSLNSFATPYNYGLNGDTPAANQSQTSPTSMASSQSGVQPSTASLGSSTAQPQFLSAASIEEHETDSFTDAEVEVLRVVVRNLEPTDAGSSSGGASQRTFSNGSAEGINGLRISTDPSAPSSAATPNE
jgi:la-related protein 1